MKKKIKKFRDDLAIVFQGLKYSKHFMGKGFLFYNVMQNFLKQASSLITIYFTGLIVTALAENRSFSDLAKYSVAATVITLFCDVLVRVFNRKNLIMRYSSYYKHCALVAKKALELDYAKNGSPSVSALRSKVQEIADEGFGITYIPNMAGEIIAAVASIIIILINISGAVIKISAIKNTGILSLVNKPVFGVIFAVLIIVCVYTTAHFNSTMEKKYFNLWDVFTKPFGVFDYYRKKYLNENESGKDVRIFHEKPLIEEELNNKYFVPYKTAKRKEFAFIVKYGSGGIAVNYILTGFVYLFVGLKALSGAFGVGKVVEYYGFISKLVIAFSDLAGCLSFSMANTEKIKTELEYFNLKSDVLKGTRSVNEIDKEHLEFEFHNVTFVYPETENEVLRDISFKITPKEHLAVVGMNGSGKSTMIKLICRLYEPTKGYITVNGVDVREYDYDEYLNLFGIVFQDFKLLAFTVAENVSCKEDYDEEQVYNCLEMAGVKNRVEEMPDKVNTHIYNLYDKDGIDLSGGEAQKIAIARALYKNAPFVILDEPTAALDPIAESEIYSRFNEIVGNKNAIYISHRLSSCRFCERIIVFHNGEIIQQGSHEKLLEDINSKYYELWTAQAQYYNH